VSSRKRVFRLPKIASRSEIQLLAITIAFQILSLITLLRVATGIASTSPSENASSTVIVIPKNLNQTIAIPAGPLEFGTPGGNTLGASLVLVLLFVGANVVVIGLLAYLYRKRRMKLFSFLVSLFLVFNVTELYFTFLLGIYSIVPIIASFFSLGITALAALRGIPWITNALALIVALELGSAFPILLQAPLNWLIPAVYAVFDIYAVYYGRLGKLVRQVSKSEETKTEPQIEKKKDEAEVRGRLRRWPEFGLLSIRLGSIEIGMADIAFYTMVPAVALLLTNLLGFFVVMVAVDIGLVLSFGLFRKSDVSPGLPVPILSGLVVLLIFSFLI
jgi:hypothetical protein